MWVAEIVDSDLAINTVRRYREVLEMHALPAVGNLRVREATVTRLDGHLKAVADGVGPPTAILAQTVLSGILGLAVRHGAAATNPIRNVAKIHSKTPDPRPLTLEEVETLRVCVISWQERETTSGRPKRGRPPTRDLLDVVDLMLGTAMRIGEVLVLRWDDVDLDEGTLLVTATVVREDQERRPRKLIRQEHPKTTTSRRRLPRFVVDMLMRRRVEQTGENPRNLVFPSAVGTLRDPITCARRGGRSAPRPGSGGSRRTRSAARWRR
ncbi:hypothetical protein GCM10025864_25050 [Luteimicrobium album]|uniref:Tyr recombinase domain-containing protein n=1 Tax=Luteimicrobium album TaxID=1054550 RepID=A0ABQ6I1V1_9MICO|nr:tyrosine-type recombinase/integrase [Luteimicrobium album]GMA24746.1 hypothetical protein GCM10025864_25050 [Luteimicrobium album]